MALFVLVAALIVMFGLFHTSLSYQRRVERRQLAVLVAQNKMEEIRAWSRREGSGYNFNDWSPYDGSAVSHPHHRGFLVKVDVEDQVLFSASSEFEASRTDQKRFLNSAKKVRVRVEFDGQHIELTSLVADPSRRLSSSPVRVDPTSPVGASLVPGDEIQYEAELFDVYGDPIPDISYRWYRRSEDFGAVRHSRMGRTASLRNNASATPPILPAIDTVVVVARARYKGKVYRGDSAPVSLDGGSD